MSSAKVNIAVVGAGIVGLCCALKLQMAGEQVLLLDKEQPGEGCSKGNAGHFASEQVLPLATPGLIRQIPKMLLDPMGPVAIRWPYLPQITPWFMRFMLNTRQKPFTAGAEAIQPLNAASIPAWKNLLQQIDAQGQLKVEGSYLVFEDSEIYQHYQNSTLTLIQHYGVKAHQVSGDELREAEPALKDQIKHAVFFPETGHTANPYQLCQTLFQHFVALGGHFQQTQVNHIQQRGSGCQIQTQEQSLTMPKVLIATGAWSKQLVQQATGIQVPLDTERGYHLMVPDSRELLTVPVSSADRKFIMTPMDEGMRLAGTVEFAGLKAPANMQRAHMLTQHAKALLPDLSEQTGESWMGFRPSLPDSLPVIDQVGSHGQILLAFAHQHLGLTQAAVTAELITGLYQQKTPGIDCQPYRLDRF